MFPSPESSAGALPLRPLAQQLRDALGELGEFIKDSRRLGGRTLVAAIVALSALIAWSNTKRSIHLDEVRTLQVGELRVAWDQQLDPQHGLFYEAFHHWRSRVGFDEFALRIPSVLAGALALILLASMARARFGLVSAWVAVGVLVTAQMVLLGFTEIRFYAFLLLFGVLSLWGALLAAGGSASLGLPLAVLGTALAFKTHPASAPFHGTITALATIAASSELVRRAKSKNHDACLAALGAMLLAAVVVGLYLLPRALDILKGFSFSGNEPGGGATSWTLASALDRYASWVVHAPGAFQWIPFAIVWVALPIVGLAAQRRHPMVACILAIPLLLHVTSGFLLGNPVSLAIKYLTSSVPVVSLLVGIGAATAVRELQRRVGVRSTSFAMGALALGYAVVAIPGAWRVATGDPCGYLQLMTVLRREYGGERTVVLMPEWMMMLHRFHESQGRDSNIIAAPINDGGDKMRRMLALTPNLAIVRAPKEEVDWRQWIGGSDAPVPAADESVLFREEHTVTSYFTPVWSTQVLLPNPGVLFVHPGERQSLRGKQTLVSLAQGSWVAASSETGWSNGKRIELPAGLHRMDELGIAGSAWLLPALSEAGDMRVPALLADRMPRTGVEPEVGGSVWIDKNRRLTFVTTMTPGADTVFAEVSREALPYLCELRVNGAPVTISYVIPHDDESTTTARVRAPLPKLPPGTEVRLNFRFLSENTRPEQKDKTIRMRLYAVGLEGGSPNSECIELLDGRMLGSIPPVLRLGISGIAEIPRSAWFSHQPIETTFETDAGGPAMRFHMTAAVTTGAIVLPRFPVTAGSILYLQQDIRAVGIDDHEIFPILAWVTHDNRQLIDASTLDTVNAREPEWKRFVSLKIVPTNAREVAFGWYVNQGSNPGTKRGYFEVRNYLPLSGDALEKGHFPLELTEDPF